MEKSKTFFDYIKDMFKAFGICTLFLVIEAYFFGDMIKDYSPMLSLGSEGIPLDILAEVLLVSAIGTFERFFFFSDKIFKNAGKVFRTVGMTSAVILTAIVFIIVFKWFPYDSPAAWLGFFISFAITFSISLILSSCKEKYKNRRLTEALEKIKRENSDGHE